MDKRGVIMVVPFRRLLDCVAAECFPSVVTWHLDDFPVQLLYLVYVQVPV